MNAPTVRITGRLFDAVAALVAAVTKLAVAVESATRHTLPPAPDRAMTDDDVAARLGVSAHTVRAWRGKGIGPRFFKMGRAVRYRLADVEAYERHSRKEQP